MLVGSLSCAETIIVVHSVYFSQLDNLGATIFLSNSSSKQLVEIPPKLAMLLPFSNKALKEVSVPAAAGAYQK